DEKVKVYIHQMIDPSIQTEDHSEDSSTPEYFTGFTEEDYLALMAKDPETLFQEELYMYMKHLRRHST
uniref:Uncharacterized protein n=1 Tax=Amphimedon queenslandica TaxID=400682 RepID=A0A1X7TFC4_AMPQE